MATLILSTLATSVLIAVNRDAVISLIGQTAREKEHVTMSSSTV